MPFDSTRLDRDLEELKTLKDVKVTFPDEKDKRVFVVSIIVNEGFFKDHLFRFNLEIPDQWPNERPKVRIVDKIWHPNIYLENGVISVATIDFYKPTYTLCEIVESLKFILVHPNPRDSLNLEAGTQMLNSEDQFKKEVQKYLDQME